MTLLIPPFLVGGWGLFLEMASAIRASAHLEVSAAFEDAVADPLSEVTILKDLAEGRQRLVGGDEDRASIEIGFEGLVDGTEAGCVGGFADEHTGLGKTGLEAVLDGAVGDGKVRLPGPGRPGENDVPAFAEEGGSWRCARIA